MAYDDPPETPIEGYRPGGSSRLEGPYSETHGFGPGSKWVPDNADESGREPAGAPAPALQAFTDVFTHPMAQEAARDAATVLNDAFQRRDIALANQRAGENFVADVDQFKSGLVSFVQNDPFMLSAALDLVPIWMGPLVATIPNVADPEAHRDNLVNHAQGEIAAAAVTRLAEQNDVAARGVLDSPRVRALLGENAAPLDTYITLQAQARATDHLAEAEEFERRRSEAVDRSAINYLGALHDPMTDGLRFPPGWNQAILRDARLPPPVKVAVAGVYNRLRTEGDAASSDPFLVSDLVQSIVRNEPPPVGEVVQMMGRGLTVADAMLLLGGAGPATVQTRRDFGNLASTLDIARDALAAPENGPAGAAAFGRFANWLLPEYRRNGPASLNAASDNFLLASNPIQAFAPTPADYADAAVLASRTINVEPLANLNARDMRAVQRSRPTLDAIFSGGRPDTSTPRMPAGYRMAADGGVEPVQGAHDPNRAPFYGVQAPMPSQRIGGGAQNINAGDPSPTEVLTDTGIKRLTPSDLARSSSGPRPQSKQPLSDDQIQAVLEGRPANIPRQGRPAGRTPRILPNHSPRRR